jgi:hypothetical protein
MLCNGQGSEEQLVTGSYQLEHKGNIWSYYQVHVASEICWGHAVAQLFEALCYKPEGRGFGFQ